MSPRATASLRCAVAAVTLATAAAGCLRPGDERARLDETVGIEAIAELSIAVDDGLAAVLDLAPGQIELWANAPALAVTVEAAADADVRLVVSNAMAGSRLRIEAGDEPPLDIDAAPQDGPPTRLAFDISLRAGEIRARLVPPATTDLSPWRFAFLADIQTGLDDVGDLFARIAADPAVRFVLLGGDATEDGTRAELEQLRAELAELPVPMYATPGNHELLGDDELWTELYGLRNASFAYRGVRVTLLDSGHATLDGLVYDRLAAWLDDGSDAVHVVGTHIPPFDPVGVRGGGWRNRREAAALYAMLAEHGVDVVLAGHIHSYYAEEYAGIPTFVSGGAGAVPSERWDGVGRHYLTVDVAPQSGLLQVALVRVD